jgi:hypothetical protein
MPLKATSRASTDHSSIAKYDYSFAVVTGTAHMVALLLS